MNITTKRILNFGLAFFIISILLPQNVLIAHAANNATVYDDSPMIEDGGNIYYVKTVQGDDYSNDIYRLEVATGNKTKLLSSKNAIYGMMIHNDVLYYTSVETEKEYQAYTYSVSIDAKDKKMICKGELVCLDDSSIFYIVSKGEKSRLYKRDYDSKKSTLIYTGNTNFTFTKNLDGTLYFAQFNELSSKLTLYTLLPGQTKLAVLTTDKITYYDSTRGVPTVSDVVKINGDIYYQYGDFEGSGYYWNGTIIKIDCSTNKKSVIVKLLSEEPIYHDDSSIFYNDMDNFKHYQYNTKTRKTSTYVYRIGDSETFNILGDRTYCGKADGKELITVACFTSGTNKKNMVKSLIHIPFKQKKKFDYWANVKKYGDYLVILVKCMGYGDNKWKGKCKYISVTWYVADSDGKILAQFE